MKFISNIHERVQAWVMNNIGAFLILLTVGMVFAFAVGVSMVVFATDPFTYAWGWSWVALGSFICLLLLALFVTLLPEICRFLARRWRRRR